MRKYQSLSEHLAGHVGDEWPANFAEVEAVLGFPLPKAARAGRAWWVNDPAKTQSRAWTTRGWEVSSVDPADGQVTFRRVAAAPVAVVPAARLEPTEMAERAASAGLPKGLIAAGLAIVAGVGALSVRALMRRR
jgi:hypothetical protein